MVVLMVNELMRHIHKAATIQAVGGKTCYISCILGHAASCIDQFFVHLPQPLNLLIVSPDKGEILRQKYSTVVPYGFGSSKQDPDRCWYHGYC